LGTAFKISFQFELVPLIHGDAEEDEHEDPLLALAMSGGDWGAIGGRA
jgi:hypothetical protein